MALREKIVHSTLEKIELEKEREDAFSQTDLRFVSSLSAAILEQSTLKSRIIIWGVLSFVILFILWASLAKIDEVTRARGKIIPSHQIQKIQYLEGGTVAEILIKEGSVVKKDQILIRIDSVGFNTQFEENKIRIFELKAKAVRLRAQIDDAPMDLKDFPADTFPQLVRQEESLFSSSMEQLEQKLKILRERLKQKKSEYKEAKQKAHELAQRYKFIEKEIALTQPMVDRRLASEVDFLKLKRQASQMKGEYDSTVLSISRLQSKIDEAKNAITEARLDFSNKAKKEYNEVISEIARIEQTRVLLTDKVRRAVLRSPVEGTVKQLFVNTIGGVIYPGRDIVEIVPLEDSLIAEVKVRPADIAYVHLGQEAVVKFSAYDFSIYGGLRGTLVHIGADTVTDEKGESYYTVRVATPRSFLGSDEKPLKIKAGMTVTVDILTGKKTVLDYIMKPILKAKENALRER